MTDRLAARFVALAVAAAVPVLASCQPAGEGGMEEAAVDTAAVLSAADSFRTAYEDAYNAADTAAVASMFSRDIVFLPAEGPPIRGREDVVSFLSPGMAMNQNISIDPGGTKLVGSGAVVDHGTVTFTVTPPDADSARTTHRHGYLIVAQEGSDGWKLVRAANTMLQTPASSKGSDGGS